MEKMGQEHRMMAVAFTVVLAITLSGLLGTMLIDRERSTGGLDVLWTQNTSGSTGVSYCMNGSVIIDIPNDREIRSIDLNGKVEWSCPYSYLVEFVAIYDHILMIDNDNGTGTVKCLDSNGTLDWSHEIANLT